MTNTTPSKTFLFMSAQYGGASARRIDQAPWLGRHDLKSQYRLVEDWGSGSKTDVTLFAPEGQTAIVSYYYDPGISGRPVSESYWLANAEGWTEVSRDETNQCLDDLVASLSDRIRSKLEEWKNDNDDFVWRYDCPHKILEIHSTSLVIQNQERDKAPESLTFRKFLNW